MHRWATWVRPRAPMPPPSVATQRGRDHTLRQQCQSRWDQILRQLGSHSRVADALTASRRPEDVLELSLRRYAPTTLQTYLRHIALFLDYLSTSELSLDALTLTHVTDFLFACAASAKEDRSANRVGPRPMLKAISWLQRQAQIPALAPLLMNPLVQAFHSATGPEDRGKPCHYHSPS